MRQILLFICIVLSAMVALSTTLLSKDNNISYESSDLKNLRISYYIFCATLILILMAFSKEGGPMQKYYKS